MDFNFRKPAHIFVLLMVLGSFILLIGIPVLSFVGVFGATDTSQMTEYSGLLKLFVEIFLVVPQIVLFVVFMIIVPVLWYFLVNRLTAKEIKSRLKLKFKEFDKMILWGILTVFLMFIVLAIISNILISLGFNTEDAGNIQDLANLLSPVAIFIIVVSQPIGEEIFFRGFLLDKIDSIIGRKTIDGEEDLDYFDYKIGAVLITSVLFGIAHLSYGNLYPAVITGILGVVLGFVVVKTKSLYPAIIAHVLFNAISLSIFFLFQDFF